MIDPRILEAMHEAGCTTEQILCVVKKAAEIDQERRVSARAANAERKRRSRSNVTDVTCDTRDDVGQSVTSLSPSQMVSPTPPSLNPSSIPKEKTPKGVQKKGHRLPENWWPAEKDWVWAVEQVGEVKARRIAETLIDWAKANAGNQKAVKSDWGATYRNFVRGEMDKYGGNHAGNSRKPNSFDAFVTGLRQDLTEQ